MNYTTTARKGKGFDDVVKGLVLGTIDTSKDPVVIARPFEQLFEQYKQMLQYDLNNVQTYFQHLGGGKTLEQHVQEIAQEVSDVLNPAQINAVLQATLPYEDVLSYPFVTGILITRLLQNSYDAGNNDFALDTSTLPLLENLASRLCGTLERKVSLAVTGGVGNSFGLKARYCSFVSHGSAGMSYGYGALECRYEIYGGCISPAVDVSDSELIFHGEIKNMKESHGYKIQDSIFRTSYRENISELLMLVPCNRGNKIYFIDEAGKEELVRNE